MSVGKTVTLAWFEHNTPRREVWSVAATTHEKRQRKCAQSHARSAAERSEKSFTGSSVSPYAVHSHVSTSHRTAFITLPPENLNKYANSSVNCRHVKVNHSHTTALINRTRFWKYTFIHRNKRSVGKLAWSRISCKSVGDGTVPVNEHPEYGRRYSACNRTPRVRETVQCL